MAGLLGDVGTAIFGDDKEKDEFGQTQMERRQPIWSGLLKTGAMLMAGGQSMMPNERAKYIAQAGGALADVPSQMVAQRSDFAKQKLAGQQIAEGQRKIANQEKMRAMSQTPEFQASVAKLDPHNKLMLQAAFDAGDLAAATAIMKSVDSSDVATARLGIAQDRLKLAQDIAERKASGDYLGTGIEGQHLTALKNEDPSSFKYWAAYQYFSTDRKMPDGTVMGKTNLVGLPEPTYKDPRTGGKPDPAKPEKPDDIGQALPPGGSVTLSDGTEVSKDAYGKVIIDSPDGTYSEQEPNKPKVTTPPAKIDPVEQRKLNEMKVAEAKVQQGGKDFLSEWRKASLGDRINAIAGRPSGVLSAWTNLAALVKESAVFNLGVLNGGDRAFIQGAIADPSSMMTLGTDPKIVEAQVQRIFNILDVGLKTHEKQMLNPVRRKGGGGAPPATPPAASAGAGAPTYNPQTGKWE